MVIFNWLGIKQLYLANFIVKISDTFAKNYAKSIGFKRKSLDTSYSGYVDKAIIYFSDYDTFTYNYQSYEYIAPSSHDITVTSTSDPIGITITLYFRQTVYKAAVGFTSGASGDNKIQVADGDTITVIYDQECPAGQKTDTAIWSAP